jgi:RNA polymerase sigma-70 factor, ECF subfamily
MRFAGVGRELLDRCRSGDMDAFDELCRAVQQELYAVIYSMLRNHDDADEALQECLVRLYRHLPQLNDLDRFPWWLMRIAVNQCNSARARAAVRALYPLNEEVEIQNEELVWQSGRVDSPRRALERKEMQTDIDAAIRELPPRQRSAVVLFEVEGRTIKEIADLLECSDGAVKFNLHEARKKLRELLKAYMTPVPAEGSRK